MVPRRAIVRTMRNLLPLPAARAFKVLALLTLASRANAQTPSSDTTSATTTLKAVTVTATRRATEVFSVPSPVTVLDAAAIQKRSPVNLTEIFRDYAGLDVIGIGGNQMRPSIRGQRGQRILLLEDGLRLGNSRRQQDFGELPSLVDQSMVERIEVVRGPASVLYGTDAIGGVMNLITAAPNAGSARPALNGQLGYRYGEAGGSNRGEGRLTWQSGAFAVQVGGSVRDASSYRAPSGSYGNVSLDDPARVENSGVKDQALNGGMFWRAAGGQGAFVRAERYRADDAGFGFVDPELIGESTKIQIQYPRQDFSKVSVGANSGALSNPFITRASIAAYRQTNGRDLSQSIFAPFGPGTPPGAGVDIQTRNHTDVTTTGFRAEAMRAFSNNIITYGADYFRDDARGRDSSMTTVVGFGPPQSESSTRLQIPNATLSSLGIFAQNDMRLHERFSVIVGGRFQTTDSRPRSSGTTPVPEGASNSTGVYAINALFRATPRLNFVATVGRGFRAPNLVERYFDGPTPEGSAYQSATPGLKPEQSLNVDLGTRFEVSRVNGEFFVFQNRIEDGIRIAFAGDSVGRLPRYENVNVSRLRTRGAELSLATRLGAGFSADGNWSRLLTKNVSDPALPVGDVYSSKVNLALGWQPASRSWWASYAVRRNGEQKEIVVGSSPIGDVLPAFTVHALRGGFSLRTLGGMRQEIGLQVNNVTNELYAEVSNAGFFRPEPRRNVVLSVTTWF
jgi:hemoglobin/transferrin/lactoferrin receptor protein